MEKKKDVTVDYKLVQALKQKVINRNLKIDFERTDIMQEIYKEYEGFPQIIIRARFLEKLLLTKKIYIDEHLIVGSLAGDINAFYLYPEWDIEWLETEDVFQIPEEKKAQMSELLDYWEKRRIPVRAKEKYVSIFHEDITPLIKGGMIQDVNLSPIGVSSSDYAKVIRGGLRALIDEVKTNREKLSVTAENKEKYDFYDAAIIVLEAVVAYAKRYSAYAKKLAKEEKDEQRKATLLKISEITSNVPEFPARSFWEALQSHFFLHLVSQLEQVGCGYSQGFLGQILEPYYQEDKKKGILDEDTAIYLLKHHFLKMNDISYYYGRDYDLVESGDTAQTINIGGYTEDGEDATGEVDYFILDAQMDLRLPQPPLAVIYHDKLKPEFVQKCIELVKTGIGMPQFMNADILVQRSLDAYARYGATIQDARRTCVFGCVSTAIEGKTAYLQGDAVNIAKFIELTLNDGKDPGTGLQIGPHTGNAEEFEDFEDLYQAFQTQLDAGILAARNHGKISNLLYSEFLPLPYRSALTGGCIESGKDIWHDGATFSSTMTVYCGGVDAANSLLVIKKLIYEEKSLSIAQLKEALNADFENYELIQKQCLKVSKHGNNIDEDQKLVQRVYRDAQLSYQKAGGSYFNKYGKPDAYSKSIHNYFGIMTGALPTGRRAGLALTDGSVSAMPGSDQKGPSALVLSAARGMDTVKYNSVHLNVKLNPDVLQTQNGVASLVALIDGFMSHNGNHIQFNCVDAETLRDAKLHPEIHKDLVVRVAGFSAFFVRLHEGIQDEIIARTEHELPV